MATTPIEFNGVDNVQLLTNAAPVASIAGAVLSLDFRVTLAQPLSSDPLSPVEGQFWENTTSHRAKVYDGAVKQVLAYQTDSLSVFATPTADLNIGTHKLINVVDPVNPQDAATKNYVDTHGGGGSVAWGAITGTLSAQTDLQSALNLKAPLASPVFTGSAQFTGGSTTTAAIVASPTLTQDAASNGGFNTPPLLSAPTITAISNGLYQQGSSSGTFIVNVPLTSSTFTAYDAESWLQGTGAVSQLEGLSTYVDTTLSSGTVVTVNGLRIATPNLSGAAATVLHGILIENQAGAATNYAIYTNSGIVHFGDNVDLAAGKVYKINGAQIALANLSDGANVVLNTRQIISGTGLTGGGTLAADRTLAVVANTTNQKVAIDKNGVLVGTRKEVNLIEGTNVTMTVTDNAGSDRVDVTINSSGGGGGSPARTTAAVTTASLAPNASESDTLTMAKSFELVGVSVGNKKCRVRLYSTAAARTADASRPYTVPLALGSQHGCIADFYFNQVGAVDPWVCSPAIIGFNADGTASTNIYANITNMDTSSQAITVTLTYVPMES